MYIFVILIIIQNLLAVTSRYEKLRFYIFITSVFIKLDVINLLYLYEFLTNPLSIMF